MLAADDPRLGNLPDARALLRMGHSTIKILIAPQSDLSPDKSIYDPTFSMYHFVQHLFDRVIHIYRVYLCRINSISFNIAFHLIPFLSLWV